MSNGPQTQPSRCHERTAPQHTQRPRTGSPGQTCEPWRAWPGNSRVEIDWTLDCRRDGGPRGGRTCGRTRAFSADEGLGTGTGALILAQTPPVESLADTLAIPLVVSIVALTLNTLRDTYLRGRDGRRRDDAVMRLVDRELHNNLLVVQNSRDAMRSVPASVDLHGAHVHVETQPLRYCSRDGRDALNLNLPRRLRLDKQDENAVYLAYWWFQRHDEVVRTYEQFRLLRLLSRNAVTMDHLLHLRGDVEHCLGMTNEILRYLGVDTITEEYAEENMPPSDLEAASGDAYWWRVPGLRKRRGWTKARVDRPPPPYHLGTMDHRRSSA